ncbi:hypothetical protein KKC65_02305, partial [Patescibacteria group bacterium]|nr:hypothetical protein [Patescibacteria group bacterium]
LKQGELVIMPRNDYEEFLRLKKIIPLVDLTPSEKEALKQGRKEIKQEEKGKREKEKGVRSLF